MIAMGTAWLWGMLLSVEATEVYYTNRTFVPVVFNIQVQATVFRLYTESGYLTGIVKGTNIIINTNETCAIEKQAIALGYGTATDAWAAAVAYDGPPSNYQGKIYDNVGWVRGTKSVNGKWGSYLWTLENRIVFKSSATNWYQSSSNGIPVAISNVLVGSMGNYEPMAENVEDIGPSLVLATNNFPGANTGEDRSFYVDYTNVYYQLVISSVRVSPRVMARPVGGSNVEYEVKGTNMPQGVQWTITTNGISGEAVLSGNSNSATVTPGTVATNYTIRATAKDNTNFYDEVNLSVVGVEKLMYNKSGNSGWSNMPAPPGLVAVSTGQWLRLKAVKAPANATWPAGKPVWSNVLYSIGDLAYFSTNTPGVYSISAECGNTVTGLVAAVKLETETVATVPTNLTRKTIGVGEEVNLRIIPSSVTGTWISTAGSVNPTNGNSTLFEAPHTATSSVVMVTIGNEFSFTVTFSVLSPSGYIAKTNTPITGYGTNIAGAGMTIGLWLPPTNVSFYRVEVVEVAAVSTNATGYFANTNVWPAWKLDHGLCGAGKWVPVSVNNYIGTDTANSGVCPPTWADGHFTWPIPGGWRVVSETPTNSLTWSDQDFTIDPSGTVTVQKFGRTVRRQTNDVYTITQ